MSAREIDDREAPEAEADGAGEEVTVVVRAAVNDGCRHRLHLAGDDRCIAREVELSADSTHSGSGRQSMQQEGEAPEDLRLCPAMHRNIVPAQEQLARAK